MIIAIFEALEFITVLLLAVCVVDGLVVWTKDGIGTTLAGTS